MDRETGGTSMDMRNFPLSALSSGRETFLHGFVRHTPSGTLWAGAFRERSAPFRDIRLEVILPVNTPFFHFSFQQGHLYHAYSSVAFPPDLFPPGATPGELTLLSTGRQLAALHLLDSRKADPRRLLSRDADLVAALGVRFDVPADSCPPEPETTGTTPTMGVEEEQTHCGERWSPAPAARVRTHFPAVCGWR